MKSSALDELVGDFLEAKASDPDISEATVAQYRYSLEYVFLPWADADGVDADRLDDKAVQRFAASLKTKTTRRGKPLSKASIATYIRATNVFLAWAAKKGQIAAVRAPGGASINRKDRPRLVVLTDEEIERLEAAAPSKRDQLIVRILSETGIRLGELLGLRVGDVIAENGKFYIDVHGKTGARKVGINRDLYRRIQAYVNGGRGGTDGDAEPLFMALRRDEEGQHRPLTASGVQQMIRHSGKNAGIRKRVYAHLLRHSFATSYLNVTGDPVTLADQLGHNSLAMIQQVYVHLADDDKHGAMMRYLKAKAERRKGRKVAD